MKRTEDIDPATISEQTYIQLEAMIMTKALGPGHVLEERPLSKILKVSRTPIRMALSRLLGEGMIVKLSNGVHAVNNINVEDFLHLLQLRRLLECEAASLAAGAVPKAKLKELRKMLIDIVRSKKPERENHAGFDDALHGAIAHASGNPWLERMIQDVRRRGRMCNIQNRPERFPELYKEHLRVIDTLEAGDADAARKAMNDHLIQVRKSFMRPFERG
jgi:DNA-binding GntR family transcriptional regulator